MRRPQVVWLLWMNNLISFQPCKSKFEQISSFNASDILLMFVKCFKGESAWTVGADRNVRRVGTEPATCRVWDSLLDYLTKLLSPLWWLSTNEPLTRRDKHNNGLLTSRGLSLLLQQSVCLNYSLLVWWHFGKHTKGSFAAWVYLPKSCFYYSAHKEISNWGWFICFKIFFFICFWKLTLLIHFFESEMRRSILLSHLLLEYEAAAKRQLA